MADQLTPNDTLANAPNGVTYFVATDTPLPDGRVLLDDRKSRALGRLSAARRVLKRVRRHTPDCFLVEVRRFR